MTPADEKDPLTRTDEAAAVWIHVDRLDDWDKNPRKNDDAAPKVAKSLVKFGFGTAMLGWLDPDNGRTLILGGHTRKKAVRILQRQLPKLTRAQRDKWHPDAIRTAKTGMLPVRVRTDLTRAQAHQLALVDNKASEWAEWDKPLLAEVLSEFSLPDVEDLGFDPKELDRLSDDLYGLGGEAGDEAKLDSSFQVVITVESEEDQLAVIAWAQENEFKCRALI